MIALILASFLSGIITIVCTWNRLGVYSILVAPLGAGAGTVLMGLVLACIRKFNDRRSRAATARADARRAATDEREQIKHHQA